MKNSMRRYVIGLAATIGLLHGGAALAQSPEAPHANVAAYDNESAIGNLAYRQSPYYMELNGTWRMHQTDSTMVYTQLLYADKSWKDYHTQLYVRCGHGCRVYVNHKLVGQSLDSRHWSEFGLDKFLKYGKNCILEIEALKASDGALLDDPRIETGLSGHPYLLFKSDPGISDLNIDADYDAAGQRGILNAQVTVSANRGKGRYYVEAELTSPQGKRLDRMGKWVVFDGDNLATVELNRSWTTVEPWTGESPKLYTAVFRLYNEDMGLEEVTGAKFGFRRVEMKNGQLLLNNKPLRFKGVVYSVGDTGDEASRNRMRQDLTDMKRYNINAVRTAGLSPMNPYFYELCDSCGLYVICDANLLPSSTRRKAIATDAQYASLFEERVKNMYGVYKNHTCIVAWSLGDTRDNGVCMTAAYKQLKKDEKHRPVIFTGAGTGTSTDITALSHPTASLLASTLGKTSNRPLIMSRSVDEKHIGELAQLWNSASNWRQFQGGFAEVWPSTPATLAEVRDVYRAIDVSIDKISIDEASFWVTNNSEFADLSNYGLEYTIFTSLQPNIISGDLPIAAPAGERCKVGMRIPPIDLAAGEELYVRFDVRRKFSRTNQAISTKNESFTFQLPQRTKRKKALINGGTPLTLHDSARIDLPSLHFAAHEKWTKEKTLSIVYLADSHTLCRESIVRYSHQGETMCDVHILGTLYSTGDVVVSYTINSTDSVQPVLHFDGKFDTVRWFGLEQSLHSIPTKTDAIGLYCSPLNATVEKRQASWCTMSREGCTTLFHLIDGKFHFAADKAGLAIQPVQHSNFRLHLRPCTDRYFATLLSFDYPAPATRIPSVPTIVASEGSIAKPIRVSIMAPPDCSVHYTVDGSDPTVASPEYTQPILIDKTTLVKARAYTADSIPSLTAMKRFSYNFIASTTFSRPPSTPYNAGADTILYDRHVGSIENLSDGWVGFSGEGISTTVALTKPISVESIRLRYAHSPATWAFAPQSISIAFSSDGETYGEPFAVPVPIDPSDKNNATPQVIDIKIPTDLKNISHIRIDTRTIASIPQWHRAKGLKPWLLMDEIEVSEASSK